MTSLLKHPDFPNRTDRATAQHHSASGHAAGSLREPLGYAQGRQALGRRREEPPQKRRLLLGACDARTPVRKTAKSPATCRFGPDYRQINAGSRHVYALLRARKASAYRIDAGMIRQAIRRRPVRAFHAQPECEAGHHGRNTGASIGHRQRHRLHCHADRSING